MKKALLTIVAVFAFCGAMFSQENHWPDINQGPFEGSSAVIAFIQINGQYITASDSYDQVEVAAFVNDEYRGNVIMEYYPEYDDPYPVAELMVFFYENETEAVTFKMYDHSTSTEYGTCVANKDVVTQTDFDEIWMGYYEDALILNFTESSVPTFTKDIAGYGESAGGYYLIASPLADDTDPANVQNMIADPAQNYDLYSFDQTHPYDEWQNYKQHGFSLVNGQGYLYASKEDVTLTFTGNPVDGEDVVIGLVYSTDASCKLPGWNLVGNPFTQEAYLNKEFYVLNQDRDEIVPHGDQNTIAPMEGAFVYADGESQNVTISKNPFNNKARLNLNLSRERGVIDRAAVNFGEGSLPKFQLNPNHTKVYIPQDGKDYAVVSSEGMGEMPVNFKAEKSGTYTLSFNAEEVSFTYLHLIDNLTKNNVDLLANPSYTFDASITDNARRFTLVFATGNNNDDNFAFYSNGEWIINNDGEATLQVVDALGRVLSSETISGSCSKAINAAAGVYMIRLINGSNDVKVQKIVVR